MTRQRGFTLLEVIIAMAIMAGIFVMAQQVMSNQVGIFSHHKQNRASVESLQRTLVFLTRDMEQLVARPVRDSFGDIRPAVEGNDQRIRVTRLGWANPFDLRDRSTMQRVGWELRDGRLIRLYLPVLDAGVGIEPEETVMLENVARVEFRFLEKGPQGDYKWQNQWPPVATASGNALRAPLPSSIEVTVELENGQSLHRFFRLVSNPWS